MRTRWQAMQARADSGMKTLEACGRIAVVLAVCGGCRMMSHAVCRGVTYHVDATYGSDDNTGASPEAAWRTIARVHRQALQPGDSVLFKRGEIWREELAVPTSGSAGDPLTFGAYGVGARPEINGADVITGWGRYGNHIYVAKVRSEVKQLFVDGQRQVRARWPNTGWQSIRADSDSRSLYSTSLTQPQGYWAGAMLSVKTQLYWIETRTVTASSEHTIRWDRGLEHGTPKTGYGFYLEGKVSEIDVPGEWCHDSGKVYLMLAEGDDPSLHVIEGSVRDYGIRVLYRRYVEVEAIALKYQGESGMSIVQPDHIHIRDNAILFPNAYGIEVYSPDSSEEGASIRISDNQIRGAGETGIHVWGSHSCDIVQNEVVDIASEEVSPRWGNGIWVGATKSLWISGNRIDRVSYSGIYADAESAVVSRNVVSNCLLSLGDGGGIYTAGHHTSFQIANNTVGSVVGNLEGTPYSGSKGTGVGIYLDEIASGYTVAGNVVFDCDLGMHLHNAFHNTVIHNVLYDNNTGIELLENGVQPNFMHDNNLYNNVFFCAQPHQRVLAEDSEYASPDTMGKYDYNLYYSPYRDDVIGYARQWGRQKTYTLDAWRAFSGQDRHSVAQDPCFVDAASHDFHLISGSPCIDAGLDVGLKEDFEGIPIPQNVLPDIGVFEYRDVRGQTPPLARGQVK